MTDSTILKQAIEDWRRAASYETNPYMQHVCEMTAQALEIELRTGVAVCSCCHKPFDGKCKNHVEAMY